MTKVFLKILHYAEVNSSLVKLGFEETVNISKASDG
jgi:hypothetical protein